MLSEVANVTGIVKHICVFSAPKRRGALCYRSPCRPCSTSYACVHVTDLKQEVKMVSYLIGEILSKLCFID